MERRLTGPSEQLTPQAFLFGETSRRSSNTSSHSDRSSGAEPSAPLEPAIGARCWLPNEGLC